MQAAKVLGDESYTQLRFQLSQSENWIEARGRVAWISASKQTAGVEFIDLSYEALIFIKNWISSIETPSASEEENAIPENVAPPPPELIVDEATNVISIPEPEKTDGVVELVQYLITQDLAKLLPGSEAKDPRGVAGNARDEDDQRTTDQNNGPTGVLEITLYPQEARPAQPLRSIELLRVDSKKHRHIGFLVGVALVLSALAIVGYVPRKTFDGRPDEKATLSENLPVVPSNGSSNGVTSARGLEASSDVTGFILQVAAMNDEKSALSLADSLRQKKLPVFVVRPAAERLYRVLVGPYNDVESAASGEAELRKQGFQAIRKRNTPPQ